MSAGRRFVLALALAASCGGAGGAVAGDAGAGDVTGDVSAGPPGGGGAVYFVPPRGPASTYAVDDVRWRTEGGEARLDYTLPRLLVGASRRVSFRGRAAGGAMLLTGDEGTATCAVGAAGLRCEERFTGLGVDLEGVRREAQRVDPAQVDARVEVARRFSVEPIGVLEAPAP